MFPRDRPAFTLSPSSVVAYPSGTPSVSPPRLSIQPGARCVADTSACAAHSYLRPGLPVHPCTSLILLLNDSSTLQLHSRFFRSRPFRHHAGPTFRSRLAAPPPAERATQQLHSTHAHAHRPMGSSGSNALKYATTTATATTNAQHAGDGSSFLPRERIHDVHVLHNHRHVK